MKRGGSAPGSSFSASDVRKRRLDKSVLAGHPGTRDHSWKEAHVESDGQVSFVPFKKDTEDAR